MSVVSKLNNLSPSMRRMVLVGGSIAVVLIVSWVIGSMTEKKASKAMRAEKPEVTVVAPTRATGVEQFTAKMGVMERNQEELARKVEKLLDSMDKHPSAGKKDEGGKSDESNADSIPSLTPTTSVFDAPSSKAPELPPPPPIATGNKTPKAIDKNGIKIPGTLPPEAGSESEDVKGQPPVKEQTTKKQIKLLGESGVIDPADEEKRLNKPASRKDQSKYDSAFIPAGSMFTGVFLNGVDAPTSAVAQKNPVPVVMRIKREAVLPNYASIDVRECFLLTSGYGQLSSERAIMRAEALSCVRNDGKVIENKLEAYIVGTDGKVGVPGKLVSKQGQMIAQSLLAGALGGLGQALNRTRVPSLNINPAQGESLYQADTMSSIFQSGIAGGIGSATNMIAKFYLDMAKETFPVVEIMAGEVGTVVVTKGSSLPLKGSTDLQKYTAPSEKKGEFANRKTEASEPASKGDTGLNSIMKSVDKAKEAAPAALDAATAGGEQNTSGGLGW